MCVFVSAVLFVCRVVTPTSDTHSHKHAHARRCDFDRICQIPWVCVTLIAFCDCFRCVSPMMLCVYEHACTVYNIVFVDVRTNRSSYTISDICICTAHTFDVVRSNQTVRAYCAPLAAVYGYYISIMHTKSARIRGWTHKMHYTSTITRSESNNSCAHTLLF